jgi:hypothetical protein
MSDERVNKARLEYEASVNRPSFDAAEAEIKNRAQRADDLTQKPSHIANAEASTKAKAAAEAQAQAEARAAQEAKRHADAEHQVFASLDKSEKKAQELAVSMTRLGNAKVGDNLARQMQIAERQLAITRRDAQSLLRLMESPTDAKSLKAIEREAQLAAKRVVELESRLKTLKAQAATSPFGDGGGPAGGGLGGPGAAPPADPGGGRGGGIGGGLRGQRALLRAGTRAVGLPGEVSQIGGLELYGGAIAGIGIGLAAIAGIREIIKLSMQAETAQINLAVSARNTGRTFDESAASAEIFRASMVADKKEAAELAAAFGQLQLKSGETVRAGDINKLANLANAQGLNPEDTAKAIEGLAKGSKEAFEQLTGTRADLVLDRYARSIGTTTSRLTEMEKVQALTTTALRLSGDNADIAARRMASLDSRWQSFKNTISDFAQTVGNVSEASGSQLLYLFSGGYLGAGPDATYKAGIKDEDARQAALNRDALAKTNREAQRKADEAEVNRQQTLARDLDKRLSDADRAQRSKPEDFQAGATSYERRAQDLASLRQQRAAAQAELEAFEKTKAQFSPDDAERFETQLQDRVQGFTDNIRQQVEQLASDVQAKVAALRQDVLNSTAEFAQLRLIDDRANPYVKLFADAEEAARKAQERFGLVGDAAVREFMKAQEAMRSAQVWELRVKDSMSAVKLEFEAAELARPFNELTGEMKRTISVFDADLKASLAQGLRANAEVIRLNSQFQHGFNGNPDELRKRGFYFDQGGAQINPDVIARQQFDRLTRLEGKYGETPGLGGEEIRDKLAQQFTKIYEGLSPRAKGEVARDPRLTRKFAGAYDEQADYEERQIGRAAERAEAQRSTVRLAEAQLNELNRLKGTTGATDAGVRAEFLRITQELPREELTPGLAKGRIAALKEEAQFQRQREPPTMR